MAALLLQKCSCAGASLANGTAQRAVPLHSPASSAAPCCSWQYGRRVGRRRSFLQASRHSVRAAAAEVDTLTYGAEWSTPRESYVVLGLAHCFERGEDGKLQDVFVLEPVSANSLECMVAGGSTCFKSVAGVTLQQALAKDKSVLPTEYADAKFCEDYDFRCDATARTWLRPHAQDNLLDIVPLGSSKSSFNYNLDQKRVLNMENVVDDSDNIKQDMSIDVYGRKADEDDAAAAAAENGTVEPPKAAQEEEEDDDDGLDDLFSG